MKMFSFTLCVLIMIIIGIYNRFATCSQLFELSLPFHEGLVNNLTASATCRSEHLSVPLNKASCSAATIHGAFNRTSANPEYLPYAMVRIEIPEANTVYECAWDDSAWFPDYVDSLWNYDFNAFLVSLGRFIISWGDGEQDTINFFSQSCSHIYAAANNYTLTVFSIYAFFNDAAVTTSGNLYRLKNLNFANCPNLRDTPVLTGLSGLEVLDLRATGINVPPVTSGLKSLQYLYFNGTAISRPPDLTTNLNIKYLSFHGCNLLTVQPLVSKLTRLEFLDLCSTSLSRKDLNDILYALCLNKHPKITSVNLRVTHGVIPDLAYISAFHAVYPQAILLIN